MEYSVYSYHSSRAEKILTPRRCDYNIKGIELEINDSSYDVREALDDMISRNCLYAPEIKGFNSPAPVVISDDGSVYRELIIKASGNKRLLETVKMLDEELGDLVDNTHNTSCHIHVNKRYLYKLGIEPADLFRTAEFFAPILYRISERDEDSQYEWAKTYIGDIEDINLFERAKKVDMLEVCNEGVGRYYILNCRPGRSSVEFRIFSNYCNFNYETIKLYLNTVDFMIDITKEMLGKSFEKEYEFVMNKTKKFFNKKSNKRFFYSYSLNDFFLTKQELKQRMIEKQKKELRNKFERIRRNQEYESSNMNLIRLLRIIRDYQFELPSIELLYDGNDIDRIEEILVQDLENELTRQ